MKQIHNSFWLAGDTLYETKALADDDGYMIQQAAPSGHFDKDTENVFLDKKQAVLMAKSILQSEGIKCD